MPDTQLTDNSPGEGANLTPQQPPQPVYGVKFDVTLKKGGKTVEIKPYIFHVISALKQLAYDDNMMILDVTGAVVPPELEGIRPEDLVPKFCAEIIGTNKNILTFGLNIQSSKIDFPELRTRTTDYFTKHSVYMKAHDVGFAFGVNWINLGFFVNTHPVYGDHSSTAIWILEQYNYGLANDADYWTETRAAELYTAWTERNSDTPFPEGNELPLVVQPNKVFARNSEGKTIRTYAAALMAPVKFAGVAQKIIDYVVIYKNHLPDFVPTESQGGFIDEYFTIVKQHDEWMENHRNIQILNVTNIQDYTEAVGAGNLTLQELLPTISTIYDAAFDEKRNRINVSVMVEDYIDTINQIDEALKLHQFAYHPSVKKPKALRTIPDQGTNESAPPSARYATRLAHLTQRNQRSTRGNTDQTMSDTDAEGNTDDDQETTPYTSPGSRANKRRNQRRAHKVQVVFSFSDVNEFPFLTKGKRKKGKKNTKSNNTESEGAKADDASESSSATPTTKNSKTDQPTTKSKSTKGTKKGERPASPTTTVPSNASGVWTTGSSFDKKTISDLRSTISTLTEKHNKEIETIKSEFAQFKKATQDQTLQPLTLIINQMQKQQEAMEQRMAKMDDLIAIFLGQHIAANAKHSGDDIEATQPPATKKSIQAGVYSTPTKPQGLGFTTPTRTFRQPQPPKEKSTSPARKNYYADLQREEDEYENAIEAPADIEMDDVQDDHHETAPATTQKETLDSSSPPLLTQPPSGGYLAFLNKSRATDFTPTKLEVLYPKKLSPIKGATPAVTSDPEQQSHRDREN